MTIIKSKNMATPIITAGDLDFQKTLTIEEKNYIHNGDNWIAKLHREVNLKALHSINYTLDELKELPLDDQERIWNKAISNWNTINS